ncbi:hypothetical protein SS50377_25503 [Spironucleus salmonicida]|uniref:Uncharacterized protein n=1 Tax=Spironucleus salmonicida TaxID=348837 RepID=V6LK96_9EUKA|nr:hypothetical protein SS50377_25503 [Spironucleus salmonicida]|eukprot:EST45050.1 Hypothetical protein SS50377_15069 [Spironucleus salmonicida]
MQQKQRITNSNGLIDPPQSFLTKTIFLDTTPLKQQDRWKKPVAQKYEFLIQRERKLVTQKQTTQNDDFFYDKKTYQNIKRFLHQDKLPTIQKQNNLINRSSAINRSERFKQLKPWDITPGPTEYQINIEYFRPKTSCIMAESARFRDSEFISK